MAASSTPPTYVSHSTTRLTHGQAHTILSSFLETADINAAYRPDAILTTRGPQSASSTSSPNLTLANLKRILAGMEGRRIRGALPQPVADANGDTSGALTEDASGSGQARAKSQGKKRRISEVVEIAASGEPMLEAVRDALGEGDEQWQDKEVFDLAQDDEINAHAGERNPAAHGPDEEEDNGEDVDGTNHVARPPKVKKAKQNTKANGTGADAEGAMSKEERKRLKKLRLKEEKSARAEQRKTKKD